MRAKQQGHPDSRPLHSVFLAFSCHVDVRSLLEKVACVWLGVHTVGFLHGALHPFVAETSL